jgi:molybdopterin molybdotransferase
METLITVERAFDLIQEHVGALSPESRSLIEANGLVLAEDIFAQNDFPAFLQSNMDGYAFAYQEGVTTYEIRGEVAAGDKPVYSLPSGKATRIFTGAALPDGADTVLVQEKAIVEGSQLKLVDADLQMGMHTRPIGSEIKKGALALEKGTLLRPNVIGFLASIGVESVLVYPNPKVGIIITGNELVKPGGILLKGKVYESNSYTLITALEQLGITDIEAVQVKDELSYLTITLSDMLKHKDLILMTGGVSVGDYDFTFKAFEASNVHCIFHKIQQKPGKPLLFGKKDNAIVFGLPGNPASVLTCFYEYVLTVMHYQTKRDITLKSLTVPMSNTFKKPAGLKHFMKAIYDGKSVQIPTGQESYKLSSYAKANCLAVIPESITQVHEGDRITIHLLP